jgi:CRP/FNR family cyclic AMP-dependent transcriptional regulator
MCEDMKLERLASIPLFAGTGPRELRRIAQLSTDVRLPAGETLCRQGRRAREMIIVHEGLATVHVDGRQVGVLVPGDFFGELPLLSGQAYTATATAATPMHVLILTRAEFASLLEDAPVVAARILRTLGGRRWTAVDGPEERVGQLRQTVGVHG